MILEPVKRQVAQLLAGRGVGLFRWGWWSSNGKMQFLGWIWASHCNQ